MLWLVAVAGAQPGPAGHWEGTLDVNNRQIQLALDLAKNDQDVWIGTVGAVTMNAVGIPISGITVTGKTVKFTVKEWPNEPAFELNLAGEGKLSGTISTAQGAVPLELKRTGEAKVELPVPSPAVSKELEGDWAGKLDIPTGAIELVVHFKNQADGTVAATMDSVTQGASGLVLNGVKQTGAQVVFELRRYGARFEGKLDKGGAKLSGDWSQGPNSMPLTLQKK
jgi:hypothetical protein